MNFLCKKSPFQTGIQSVLDTVSLQAMEGKKVFALFLLLSALVATAHTRPQAAINPKQPLSPEAVPGLPHVEPQVKAEKAEIPRPEGALNPCPPGLCGGLQA